ncbi:Co2+/Mg2+ efflux protein ApaG [Acidithiobacillus sp. CV18-2]|uniref:Protein ApaG n=1 Tax=Igneacidithiobacillus copahuensis TaxID=2724909 RepID=A0AAE2YQA7_9PROT|nr:Co2+/Mg2+ efflux protein ApaG [Igneacidithiobacillus copahuensis]MBU2753752.1 Co2+/Mg2+ efflux protein ApaG [Acidithiobacillus sp. CV18-3]MBU2756550.1 Co2+/Mg2+ efflux protein ApaG [Acidithiobacillus sp. BN09-2]MBU2776485.1 Co2+/Mg2+ efflux protein ApaG [Acidithiobacillus sp. CV18-2]MBU2795177.1 Co2+/Mg2+ efflux protein ApaG [Acidithiobacillus sp. VAN18-2]MBU2799195.1 Co2+/Mg2+ efflux protein ApaG [Acidithiobacillus sp. VAN18-4]UTV81224.1 Co2+/Mg2+ efflux protein ApaG [Acidithiobacillus sp
MSVPTEIQIQVDTRYIPEQSSPEQEHYVFAYQIRIENHGPKTAQLRNRHWIITDADGRIQEVRGPGVVGEHPTLAPGEHFQYTSGTVLPTPVGSMHGSYEWVSEDGDEFETPIPAFRLAVATVFH